jgi:hypothetical protein
VSAATRLATSPCSEIRELIACHSQGASFASSLPAQNEFAALNDHRAFWTGYALHGSSMGDRLVTLDAVVAGRTRLVTLLGVLLLNARRLFLNGSSESSRAKSISGQFSARHAAISSKPFSHRGSGPTSTLGVPSRVETPKISLCKISNNLDHGNSIRVVRVIVKSHAVRFHFSHF